VFIVSVRQTSVPLLLARFDWSGTCVILAGGSTLAALAFAAAPP
jgi:hypothetical protein